jgi:hypothetical protein
LDVFGRLAEIQTRSVQTLDRKNDEEEERLAAPAHPALHWHRVLTGSWLIIDVSPNIKGRHLSGAGLRIIGPDGTYGHIVLSYPSARQARIYPYA